MGGLVKSASSWGQGGGRGADQSNQLRQQVVHHKDHMTISPDKSDQSIQIFNVHNQRLPLTPEARSAKYWLCKNRKSTA